MTTPAPVVPAAYDLNRVFGELPVLNQGQAPTCVLQTRATLINAFERIWRGKATRWTEPQAGVWTESDGCTYRAALPDGTVATIVNGSCAPGWTQATRPADLRRLVATNGVAELGVPSRSPGFAGAWTRGRLRRLPVIDWADHGPSGIDHDVTVVGYHRRGLIVQNSWGLRYGHRGRAILSWRFIANYGCRILEYGFDGHPTGSLVLPS